MKPAITLFSFICAVVFSTILVSTASGQPNSKLPIRIVSLWWNYETQYWDSTSSIIYQYDDSNRIMSLSTQDYTNNIPENRDRRVYVYNSDGYQLEEMYEGNLDGVWITQIITKTEYDEYNNKVSYLVEERNGDTLKTTLEHKYELELNNLNQVLVSVLSIFNPEDNTWRNSSREVFTYNTDGSINSSIASDWVNNTWLESKRTLDLVYYNDTDKLESTTFQNFENGKWINSNRFITKYLAPGKRTSFMQQTWIDSTSSWQTRTQDSTTFDTHQNPILNSSEIYDPKTNTLKLIGEYRFKLEYNSDNTIHKQLIEYRNQQTKEWSIAGNNIYFYNSPTGIVQQDFKNPSIKIFPNPTSKNIIMSNAEGEISLFSQSGQKIWSGKGLGDNINIDISQFPAGQYILKIESSKGVQLQKVMIVR